MEDENNIKLFNDMKTLPPPINEYLPDAKRTIKKSGKLLQQHNPVASTVHGRVNTNK